MIRHDRYLDEFGEHRPAVKVKEVVQDLETARREVARLNALQDDDDCVYWWQATQLHPPGQAASGDGEAGESD